MNGLELARALLCGDGEPPLTFQRWRALAPLLAGRDADERAELVAADGIEPACWERADGYWSLTLAAECARGDRTRAEDFGRACAEELEARRQAPPVATEDTLPEGVPPPVLPAQTASLDGEPTSWSKPLPEPLCPVQRAEVSVPTFLRAEAAEPRPQPLGPALSSSAPLPAPVPAPLGTATLEISPFAITAGRAAVPFLAVSGRSPVLLPSYATPLPRRSGLTLDLSTTAVPSLLPPSSAAPPPASVALPAPESTGRDRRTEAGTVALDPSQLDALFGRKPQK